METLLYVTMIVITFPVFNFRKRCFMTQQENTDYPYGDIKIMQTETFDFCRDECLAREDCFRVMWNTAGSYKGRCHIKNMESHHPTLCGESNPCIGATKSCFALTGSSWDVLAGRVATLTCQVEGISATDVSLEWVDSKGDVLKSDAYYTINPETLTNGTFKSTLVIKGIKTFTGDADYKCQVSVMQKVTEELIIPLKTFKISVIGDSVKSLESATLTCSVTEASVDVSIQWIKTKEKIMKGVTAESSETGSTTSKLIIEDATGDEVYTCKVVVGENEYTYNVDLEINDLSLTPKVDMRVFTGTKLILMCTYISTTISDGKFVWNYEGQVCRLDACNSPKETPKYSKITLNIRTENSGKWKCIYIKTKNNKQIKSNVVPVTEVAVVGTQFPVSVWGIAGTRSTVTCTVPRDIYNNPITSFVWYLSDKKISEDGDAFNANNEPVLFDTPTITDNEPGERVSYLSFTHSKDLIGVLKCKASYQNGEEVEPVSSQISGVTLNSNKNTVTITPKHSATVTFTSQAYTLPTSRITINGVTAKSKSKQFKPIVDGKQLTEIIEFSREAITINSKEELSLATYSYIYQIEQGPLEILGTVYLTGESYVETPIWCTIGGKVQLNSYVTIEDMSLIVLQWQRQNNDGQWKNIPDGGYFPIVSELDSKNILTASLVIDLVSTDDISKYRVEINVGNVQLLSNEIDVKAISVSLVTDSLTIFEKSSVTLSGVVSGPRDKKPNVKLIHEVSGSKTDVNGVTETQPGQYHISYDKTLTSTDIGNYYFEIVFSSITETSVTLQSGKMFISVKSRCKPTTPPPNTELFEELIANSSNYYQTVICINEQGETYEFLDSSKTKILCNVDSGTYSTSDLSPCLRTFKPTK